MAKRKLLNNRTKKKGDSLKKKRAKLAYYLSKGLCLKDAKTLAKVDEVTLGLLRSDPDFEDFIQKSTLEYEQELTDYIEEAASLGTWQAAAWLLERKFPEKYGKKDMVKHEYTIKIQNFQRIVLDTINKESPELKYKVIQALKSIDTKAVAENTQKEIEHIVDAEYSDD